MGGWISVKESKPKCKRGDMALGTPVLIWPRDSGLSEQLDTDGFAYFGRRVTGSPEFYMYGRVLRGVTHWQYLPEGPTP